MLSSPLFWRLFLAPASVILLIGAVLSWGVLRWEEQRLVAERSQHLARIAERLKGDAIAGLATSTEPLAAAAGALTRDAELRITLLRSEGEVLFDSNTTSAPDQVENLELQPEIQEARATGQGEARRIAAATGDETLYYALRLDRPEGTPLGIIRVGTSLDRQTALLSAIRRRTGVVVLLGLLATFFSSMFLWRRLARPLVELTAQAQAMAAGDYRERSFRHSEDELGRLIDESDRLRRALSQQIDQLRQTGERMASVLGSMIEGVLAVDDREHILFANRAARTLLEFATPDAVGRPLLEAVRNRAVLDVVRQASKTREPTKSEFDLAGSTRRVVAVNASPLPGNPYPGVLLVLHDVSDLRRLERLRQEFVANVSHELKTPLTAIKAFAETLLDGALQDQEHNEAFVRRIAEQAERLHQLIMDLLSIARIEAGQEPFELAAVDVGQVVAACAATHSTTAEGKQIRLVTVPPPEPVRASADEEGLRQILDNLIDNAIKYTPAGGTVTVRWSVFEALARIHVEDTGIGIAPEDQSRVFERFYRVDKARSRELGGTGLGLSIVKHLAQSFGGGVSVRSETNRGSTFQVWLPLA